MSNIDSGSFVDIPSSLDSASGILKDTTMTYAVSPSATHRESRNQLSDIPDDWKPPSRPCARRFMFTLLCKFALQKPDLEEVWQEVRNEDGWKTYDKRIHDELMGLRMGQVLVLFASFTCLISPGAAKHLDEYPWAFYHTFLMVSFLVSFQGLLCDMFVRLSAPYMESRDIREEGQRLFPVEGCSVLAHISYFCTARFLLAYSLGLLAGTISVVVPGGHIIASIMVACHSLCILGRYLHEG
ncbi:hypothetical protein BD769DRAFT_1779022 [Suillus cothurnatus]|nr:hypothetical protein BD769DRAFT_1779022 [Suillus cothurnatus]